MPEVNIAVITVSDSDAKERCRWSVCRDGEEIVHGVALDEEAAYEAAKPHFERLRAAMAHHTCDKAI